MCFLLGSLCWKFVSIGFLEDMSEESMERLRILSLSSRPIIAMVGESLDSVIGSSSTCAGIIFFDYLHGYLEDGTPKGNSEAENHVGDDFLYFLNRDGEFICVELTSHGGFILMVSSVLLAMGLVCWKLYGLMSLIGLMLKRRNENQMFGFMSMKNDEDEGTLKKGSLLHELFLKKSDAILYQFLDSERLKKFEDGVRSIYHYRIDLIQLDCEVVMKDLLMTESVVKWNLTHSLRIENQGNKLFDDMSHPDLCTRKGLTMAFVEWGDASHVFVAVFQPAVSGDTRVKVTPAAIMVDAMIWGICVYGSVKKDRKSVV